MADKPIVLRDVRKKEQFIIDDAYLNGYARLCGWKATLVYSSLCRHANRDQFSFPSVDRMAKEHAVSKPTIIDGIKILEEWNIINVSRTLGEASGYTLLDKTAWKQKPEDNQSTTATGKPRLLVQNVSETVSTSKPRLQVPVNDVYSKDTHIKDIDTKTPAKTGLFPCEYEELWTIAWELNISLDAVKEKHQQIMEMIQDGYFQKKYKHKTVYFTLRNWLRMDKSKGQIEELDEIHRAALNLESPENQKEIEETTKIAKEMGLL